MPAKAQQTVAHRHNVFILPVSRPLRLELSLLLLPALAIVLLFALLPSHNTSQPSPDKVKLRVTSHAPPADPELAREKKLVEEQVRFALSKLATPSQIKAALAAHPDKQSVEHAKPVTVAVAKVAKADPQPALAVTRTKSKPARETRSAYAPRDIRPSIIRAAVQTQVRQLRVSKVPAEQQSGWLKTAANAWKWPAQAASATLEPVRNTVVRSVEQAGDALVSIKRKIL